MRAQWREATTEDERPSAYSLDAIAEEVLFLLGPLAASGLMIVGPAWWGIAISAALIPVGVLGLVTSPYVPPRRESMTTGNRADWRGPFSRPGFRRLVIVMAAGGFAMSATLILLAGEADRTGQQHVVGLVEAAAGIASVLGALWWGRRSRTWGWPHQMAALLATRLTAVIVCVVHPAIWTVAVTFALTGFVVAPTYVVAYAGSDHETDPQHHTEASTWVTSLNNIGISLGTASAGWLYIHTSPRSTFVAIGVLLAAAVIYPATAPAVGPGSAWGPTSRDRDAPPRG